MATRFYSSVEYGGQRRGNDADCIYYNATIVNNSVVDTLGSNADPQVTFNEVRATPILQDPSDYMVTVVKVSSSGATLNLPLWIPRIQTGSVQATFTGKIVSNILTILNTVNGFLNPGQTNVRLIVNGINTGLYILSAAALPNTYNLSGTYTGPVNPQSMSLESLQNDPSLTVYSVSVETPLGLSVSYLRWAPVNINTPPPNIPIIQQQLDTDYYYSYTFQQMVDMVNAAIQQAWVDSGAGGLLSPPPATPTPAPLFQWLNYGNKNEPPVFGWVVGGVGINAWNSSGISVYLNTPLENMITNFPGSYTNLDAGRTFRLRFIELDSPGDIFCEQNYPSVSSWSPVENLCITSSILPLVMEQTPAPGAVGTSSFDTQGDVVGSSFLPMLLDDIPLITSASDWRQTLLFQPNAEYRMISLSSTDAPIQNVDLQMWWRNRMDNGLYPLRLVSGSSVYIKILFRRKQMGV